MKKLKSIKINKKFIIWTLPVILILFGILYFTFHDEGLYKDPIAKIKMVKEKVDSTSIDSIGNKEKIYDQNITAIIMNGKYKGDYAKLQNTTSYSEAYDYNFKVGDEVFIILPREYDGKTNTIASIDDAKRDTYIVEATIIFVFLIILVAGIRGFTSLISLIVNIAIFITAIMLYLNGMNLFLVCIPASILFIVISLLLVGGINKGTLSAIVSTSIGTIIAMLIAIIVISITKGKGVYYEEMEFLTKPPEQIFMIEILIGTLGGIMDIAISISSSIKELCTDNPSITSKELKKSGKEIGKDIMGTMTNTLFFAYICGSIPWILLWLKNGLMFSYIINVDLSLEIIRALTGSIGIVISIPITIYIAILFFKKKRGAIE